MMKLKNLLDKIIWIIFSVPLYFKIMGIGAIVAVVFGTVSLFQIQKSITYYLYEELKQNTFSIAFSLAEALARPLAINDIFSVHQIIKSKFDNMPEIQYIIIKDWKGDVVAHTFEQRIPFSIANLENNFALSKEDFKIIQNDKFLIFDVSAPILKGKAGTLRLGVSDQKIKNVLSQLTKFFLFTFSLCIIIGQILALLLTYLLVRPINHLVMVSNRIRQRDFNVKSKIYSADEIGKLALAFNQMAISLKEYEEEVRNKERERISLIKKIVSAQEDERKAIAQELHDHFGQSLSTMLLMAQSISPQEKDFKSKLKEIEFQIKNLIDDIRNLAFTLRPSILDDYGLESALKRYLDSIMKHSKIKFDFQVIPSSEERRLPTHIETSLYRIAQEAISNILRHSKAKRASILLLYKNKEIMLIIEDDGIGFNLENTLSEKRECLGLIGMRERVNLLEGSFDIETSPGKGTSIHIKIPI